MVKKRSGKPRSTEPPDVDDLKLIKGIGPAVEKRLKGAGIHTFAQLAALLPADIVAAINDIAGMTTEHILREDWIGQARKLAESKMAAGQQTDVEALITAERQDIPAVIESPGTTETERDLQRSAMFTVIFEITQDNDVLRTEVIHAQSNEEETWHGWQEAKLIEFMAKFTGIKPQPVQLPDLTIPQTDSPPPVKPVTAIYEENIAEPLVRAKEDAPAQAESPGPVAGESTPAAPVPTRGDHIGSLRINEFQTLLADSHNPCNAFRADEPYEVHLIFDLIDAASTQNSKLAYTATFYGQSLSGSARYIIGIANGTTSAKEHIFVYAGGRLLPRGIYRLEALVSVKLVNGGDATGQDFVSYARGDIIEIY